MERYSHRRFSALYSMIGPVTILLILILSGIPPDLSVSEKDSECAVGSSAKVDPVQHGTRFTTTYTEDFDDRAKIDQDNTTAMVRTDSGRAYLWASTPVFPVEYTGTKSIDTRSHGGGYSPKYNEYWYPQWSGSTIYRYDKNRNYIGSFNSGTSSMMQVWGDVDGTYYTANWGNDRVYKWSDMGSSQQWSFHMGSTTGGVCCDENYVYGLRWSHNQIRVLRKSDGQNVRNFNLPQSTYCYGGLACANGYLYVGGYGNDYQRVGIFDLETEGYVGDFRCSQSINNMAFTGEEYCISANSNTIYCYRISNGNAYTGTASQAPVDTAHVQSKVMDSTPEDIGAVLLNVTDHSPEGTDITYRISADGWHWETVVPGEPRSLAHPGSRLMWNATLHTDDPGQIPYIANVEIGCDLVSAPEPFEPGESSWQPDYYPTLSWNFTDPDPGDDQSAFQVEIYADPDGSLLEYDSGWVKSSTTSYTITGALADGRYYWRVRTKDDHGGISNRSAMRRLLVDMTAPRGNLTIGDGSPTVNDRQVELHMEVQDSGSGVEEMQIIDDRGFEGTWEDFTESASLSLSLGDGRKKVGLRLKDGAGLISEQINAFVYLDLKGPFDLELSSSTHPDQDGFYSSSAPEFNWQNPVEVSGIKGFSYMMDQSSTTVPGPMTFRPEPDLRLTGANEFSGLSDGTWYFHIAACDIFDQWSNVTHYRVNIDSEVPSIYDMAPDRTIWRNSTEVEVSCTIKEAGGSGLDMDSIELCYRKADDPNYGKWSSVGIQKTIIEKDRDEIPIKARVSQVLYLSEGSNYLKWRAADRAGNGPAASGEWLVQVDTTPLVFKKPKPKEGSIFLDPSVLCSITADDDLGSGVDGWSVEYAISPGSADPDSFVNWTSANLEGAASSVDIRLDIEFPPGKENYLMWRARDAAGNAYSYSDPINVQVNSPPVPLIGSPVGTENYTAGRAIKLDAKGTMDADGDTLSFYWQIRDKRLEKVVMGVSGNGKDVVLKEGVFTVILYVNDGKGYNISAEVDVWMEGGSDGPSGANTAVGAFFSEWWWLVIILMVFVQVVIILIILKRRKGKDDDDSPRRAVSPPVGMSSTRYPASSHPGPYPSGGHTPPLTGGYIAPGKGQAPPLSPPPSRPMLPAAPAHAAGRMDGSMPGARPGGQTHFGHGQEKGVGVPGGRPVPHSPSLGQSLSPSPLEMQGPAPSLRHSYSGSPDYTLPQFSTEKGSQDLNLPALPPASGGAAPGDMSAALQGQSAVSTPAAPTVIEGPRPAPLPRIVNQDAPSEARSDLTEIRSDLESIFGGNGKEGSSGTAAPQIVSPAPVPPSPMFIKCHACSSLNPVTTSERPTVIKCATCGEEGYLAQ